MKTQEIFIAHPKTTEQFNALRAFMQALKIRFEVTKEEDYNPDFVAKIQQSRKEFAEGKFTRVDKNDLQNLLGL
jgi:adenylate kinase family enzyme